MNASALLIVASLLLPSGSTLESEAGSPWRLTVASDAPRAIVVGTGRTAEAVWYQTLTVTNDTGEAREIVPFATLSTELGASMAARHDPRVLRALRATVEADVVDLFDLKGSLAAGESRRVVVVWGSIDAYANHYTVHLSGLASSLVRSGAEWVRTKTDLVLQFHRVGNERRPLSSRMRALGSTWQELEREKIR